MDAGNGGLGHKQVFLKNIPVTSTDPQDHINDIRSSALWRQAPETALGTYYVKQREHTYLTPAVRRSRGDL
jgi:hypothetical protein